MIPEPRKTGLLGEMYASSYLRKKGYEIYAANYRTNIGEIDIVARKDDIICFVEVKTRREGGFFPPADAVDTKKEENVKSAAAAYLAKSGLKMTYRFDIIEVIICEDRYKVRHSENAF